MKNKLRKITEKNLIIFLIGILIIIGSIIFIASLGGGPTGGIWMDLSENDTGNWAGTSAINSVAVDLNNSLIYTASSDGLFGAYNHSNGIWMNLSGNDTGNWAGNININAVAVNTNNSLVYTGHDGGLFGVYNNSNGVWTDLSATDGADWVGTTTLTGLAINPNNNLVYTTLYSGKFGVYTPSSNSWTDLSASDTGNWVALNNVNSVAVNKNDNLVYTGIDGGQFGKYNPSNGIWMNLSGNDTGGWADNHLYAVAVNSNDNLVYTILFGGLFGVYNDSNGIWMNLSGNDTGNWVGVSDGNAVAVNTNDNLVYTGLVNGQFGVYNHSNGIWMDLSANDTGGWANAGINREIAVNTNDNLIYTASGNGLFGVYNNSVAGGGGGGDTTPPNVTILNSFPANGSTYSSSQRYNFNATIVDNNNLSDIKFEWNGVTNYTPVNTTADPSIFNITLPLSLNAGVYSYKWIANDSSNNWNTTETGAFTILNATSVGNLTINGFDRNITVHSGISFTINATLLTGVFNDASINLTMNNTQINFSSSNNISHTITLSALEDNVNFTMVYSGNQNYSRFTETWFANVKGVNITLVSPINEFNSSTANQTFSVNGTTTEGLLTNSTLFIWNLSGSLVYNETTTETSISQIRNISKVLDSIDYLWNYQFCNNESSCGFAAANYTLRIYGADFVITSAEFSNWSLNELAYVKIGLNAFTITNNNIKHFNITIKNPQGNILLDNVNATWGFTNPNRYNTSQTLTFNNTGEYEINATLTDRFGKMITKMQNVSVIYTLTSTPGNYSFTAINNKTETKRIDYVLYDDSEGLINVSLTATIRDLLNFTLELSTASIMLNGTENNINPAIFNLTINASSTIANGSYIGNITIQNSTFGITRILNFTYFINPPSGIPTINKFGTDTACSSLSNDNCSVKQDNIASGTVSEKTWTIKNTGEYELKRCDAKYLGTFNSASFIVYSHQNFTLGIGSSINLTATFTPTGVTPGYGIKEDYLYIYCIDGDLGGNPVSTSSNQWVYTRINVKMPGDTQGGGGAGGGAGGGGGVKIIVTQGNWTMKTNTGISFYNLQVSAGQKRTDKSLLFKNIGDIQIPINLTCEGALCSNIVFEQISFLLPVNKALITQKGFVLNVPEDLLEGSYSVNLVATDNLGQREVVTVNFDVTKFNIIAPFQKAISGKIKFLKGTMPLWTILLVILIFGTILSYKIMWKRFSLGPVFSFLTGLVLMTIALILIPTIEPAT